MANLFMLSSLAELNGQTGPFSLAVPTVALPYEDMLDLEHIDAFFEVLLPLQRALLLAGFQVWKYHLGLTPKDGSDGTAPRQWIEIDMSSQLVSLVEPPLILTGLWNLAVETSGTSVGWAFAMEVGARLSEPTADVPASTRFDFDCLVDIETDLKFAPSDLGSVTSFTNRHLTLMKVKPLGRPSTASELLAYVTEMVTPVRIAAAKGLKGKWTAPEQPNPANQTGLLWLLNPTHWYDGDPPEGAVSGVTLRNEVSAIASSITEVNAQEFFEGQLLGTESLEESLTRVTGVRDWRSARRRARDLAKDIESLADELGGLLDRAVRRELTRLPLFEVLLHLIHAGVITPPSLPPSVDLYSDEEEEPLQARYLIDSDSPADAPTKVELLVVPAAQKVLIERASSNFEELKRMFTWEYYEDHPDGPTLTIVAGPGIALSLLTFTEKDDTYEWVADTGDRITHGWKLDIIRVQSYSVIPEWGAAVNRTLLLTPYVKGAPTSDSEPGVLLVTPKPDGMIFRQPADPEATDFWELDVTVDQFSAEDRFSYAVNEVPFPEERDITEKIYSFQMVLMTTVAVHIKYSASILLTGGTKEYDPDNMDFTSRTFVLQEFYLFECSFDDILDPGFQISSLKAGIASGKYGERGVNEVNELTQGVVCDVATLLIDVSIGFIPVVGDVADAYELFGALLEGTDRWGRPVSKVEIFLMAGGTLVPYVSSAWLRGLGRALDDGT